MAERFHQNPRLILPEGTQVVALREVIGAGGRIHHPRGAVGVVVAVPDELDQFYRIRFLDGVEDALPRGEIVMLTTLQGRENWRSRHLCFS
ncbi:MAG: hypothetical protein ACKOUR_06070 [Planctomycetota bacterium]